MKTKQLPVIIMLTAGAITCIVTYVNRYTIKETLMALCVSMIIFLIVGIVAKKLFDSFQFPGDNAVDDEGQVIEKQPEEAENADDDTEAEELAEESKEGENTNA